MKIHRLLDWCNPSTFADFREILYLPGRLSSIPIRLHHAETTTYEKRIVSMGESFQNYSSIRPNIESDFHARALAQKCFWSVSPPLLPLPSPQEFASRKSKIRHFHPISYLLLIWNSKKILNGILKKSCKNFDCKVFNSFFEGRDVGP